MAGARWAFRGRWALVSKAALGVFFRFHVTDFDVLGFFSLCHCIFPSYLFWVVCRLCQ
jgi:hypothetical protein